MAATGCSNATRTARSLRPNARFCAASQCTANHLEGLRLSLLFDDCPERHELRRIGEFEEPFRGLVVPLHVSGQKRWWSLSARPVRDADGVLTSWRGFVTDVTRTRKAEDRVNYMAHYDPLTNLPNRSLFNTTLDRALERRAPGGLVAALYVDLDHFKGINDTLGHATGDRALAEAARRIEDAAGIGATTARLGGDEFAVLLDHIADRAQAVAIAERIVQACRVPLEHDGQYLPMGASVGIAFAPGDGADGESLLRAADLALYDAKAGGRGGARCFDPAMQELAHERRLLEHDLRAALALGQLELRYQPLVDTDTGETAGYEALLRWNHPTRGEVAPSLFVPIAEDIGQIVAIGTWVLREALREAARWPDHLFVSANLSPAQLRDGQLLPTLVQALGASGLDPQRLELEITETMLMQGQRGDDRSAPPHTRPWRGDRARRFRDRLFLAQLPAQLPVQQDQDRPLLRQQHG